MFERATLNGLAGRVVARGPPVAHSYTKAWAGSDVTERSDSNSAKF